VKDDILLGRSNVTPPSTVHSANDGVGKVVSIDYHVPSMSDKRPDTADQSAGSYGCSDATAIAPWSVQELLIGIAAVLREWAARWQRER
jgi:hypothetical protein